MPWNFYHTEEKLRKKIQLKNFNRTQYSSRSNVCAHCAFFIEMKYFKVLARLVSVLDYTNVLDFRYELTKSAWFKLYSFVHIVYPHKNNGIVSEYAMRESFWCSTSTTATTTADTTQQRPRWKRLFVCVCAHLVCAVVEFVWTFFPPFGMFHLFVSL